MGIFREVAKSDLPGIIFTMVWAFDLKEDEEYVEGILDVFKEAGAQICLVELSADLKIRLERNKTENRLREKASKRDVVHSEKILLQRGKIYRMNSLPGEFPDKQILKIDNTQLSALAVARQIHKYYAL